MTDNFATITRYRKARGWAEYQLAERSDLSQSTVSSWYKKAHDAIRRVFREDMMVLK